MSWLGRLVGYSAPSDHNPYRASLGHVTVEAVKTFNALLNTFSQTFSFKHDEALRQDPQFALAMRRDPFLRSLIQERLMPLTRWKWSVVPEDPTHKEEQERAKWYEEVLKATPRFSKQRLYLGHAVWFGRYASQVAFVEDRIAGKKCKRVGRHLPLNGDKLIYHWDGTPCVAINPMAVREYPKEDVHYGDDRGRPFLALRKPEYRQQFIIHVHELDDADYMEPEMAGRIEGIGLRDFCYYGAFLRSRMIQWAVAFMEKVGTLGLLIFYYPEGNDAARKQAEASAKAASNRNALAIPIPKGGDKKSAAAELLPANMTGVQFLVDIISGWWERHIERLFVGQSMSAGEGSEGTGSTDRANLAKDTKYNLLQFDATGQQESYSCDLLPVLFDLNGDSGWKARFEYSLPDPEAEAKLGAITKAASIPGAKLTYKASEVRQLVGMSEPGPDDETVGGDPPQPGMGPDGQPLPPGTPPTQPGAATPAANTGNPTPAPNPPPSSGGVNSPDATPKPGEPAPTAQGTADSEEEQEPHPEAEAFALAMTLAAEEGDEDAVDALKELAQDQDALDGMLDDDAAEQSTVSYAASSTVGYDWTAGTTKKGHVMAVGSGKHAGQKLYGAKAEAALRGREKGKDDAPKSKPTATEQPTSTTTATPAPTTNPKQAKQDAAHAAALKAVTDPVSLTPDELVALADHLKTLPVAKLKKLAAAIKTQASGTKVELAGRLLSYVKTRQWAASDKRTGKPVTEVIAESVRGKAALEAVNAASAHASSVRKETQPIISEMNRVLDELQGMDKKLWEEHKLDMQNQANWDHPLAQEREKFRVEKARPALEAGRAAFARERQAEGAARKVLTESLKPPTPQTLDTTYNPAKHGGRADLYGKDFQALEGEEAAKAQPVFDAATDFVQGVANGMDGAKIQFGVSKKGRAWAAKKGTHHHAGSDYIALISAVPGDSKYARQSAETETAVHELGHVIEFHKPGVKALANQFLAYRCKDEKPTPLSEAMPGAGYGKDESGRKDDFAKVFGDRNAYYVGKAYSDGSTEVISMGLERLYKDPAQFAFADPEYFQFLCHILSM